MASAFAIPPDVLGKLFDGYAVQGTVIYWLDVSVSPTKQHNFVLLNNPTSGTIMLMACAQSNIAGRQRARRHQSAATLVVVTPVDYAPFTMDTIFDCNSPIATDFDALKCKYVEGLVLVRPEPMPPTIVKKLIAGIVASTIAPAPLRIQAAAL